MKNMCLLPVWAVLLIIAGTFFSCEKEEGYGYIPSGGFFELAFLSYAL